MADPLDKQLVEAVLASRPRRTRPEWRRPSSPRMRPRRSATATKPPRRTDDDEGSEEDQEDDDDVEMDLDDEDFELDEEDEGPTRTPTRAQAVARLSVPATLVEAAASAA